MPRAIQQTQNKGRGNTWPIQVAKLTSDLDFPLNREEARDRIKGIDIRGRDVGEIVEDLDYPIESPAELMDKISKALG